LDNIICSIVTPTFNRASYLPALFESVKAQHMRSIEHIVVDNMSSDNTPEIVEQYSSAVPYPVIYIREKDSGIYNAMNKGIAAARGTWVHILNSDDCYAGADVLAQVFTHDAELYDAISCAVKVVNPATNEIRTYQPHFSHAEKVYRLPHPGVIIKNIFYRDNGTYNEHFRIVADVVFSLKYLQRAKLILIAEPLVQMAAGGLSDKMTLRHFYERLLCTFRYQPISIINKLRIIANDILLLLKAKSRSKKS
jgi:glycosyltransferase